MAHKRGVIYGSVSCAVPGSSCSNWMCWILQKQQKMMSFCAFKLNYSCGRFFPLCNDTFTMPFVGFLSQWVRLETPYFNSKWKTKKKMRTEAILPSSKLKCLESVLSPVSRPWECWRLMMTIDFEQHASWCQMSTKFVLEYEAICFCNVF